MTSTYVTKFFFKESAKDLEKELPAMKNKEIKMKKNCIFSLNFIYLVDIKFWW